jgi:hypothetical protein
LAIGRLPDRKCSVQEKRLSAPLIEILSLPVALAAGPEIRWKWPAPEFL